MAGGAGRLYRWIKAGAPAVPGLAPDPGAEQGGDNGGPPAAGSRRWIAALRGGPAARLRRLE
eukprot:2310813-Lingulodinium_polyedra.AAC.1